MVKENIMNDIFFKKEIARLTMQLGQLQMYIAELEEKIINYESRDNRKYDDISNEKLKEPKKE